MVVVLDEKRRLRVPNNFTPTQPGDHFEALFDAEEDSIIFRRIKSGADWLEVLKDCPVSMDDVPPRSRELPRRPKL